MDVGIRELKAKLSHYVARASEGESVTITDRGKPVAQLTAIGSGSQLDRGLREGWIEAPRRTRLTEAKPVRGLTSIRDALDEDRS